MPNTYPIQAYTSKDVSFVLKDNIQRIISLSNTDTAFFYLSLISFIEGYFRSKNPEFDFDNPDPHPPFPAKNWSLSTIIEEVIKTVKNSNFTDQEKDNYVKNLRYINKLGTESGGKGKENHYISGNRIRHSFCKQYNDSLCTLIEEFEKLSRNFGFNTSQISDLLNLPCFSDRKSKVFSLESSLIIQENKEHEDAMRKLEASNTFLLEKVHELESQQAEKEKLQEELNRLTEKLLSLENETSLGALTKEILEKNKKIKYLEDQINQHTKTDEIGSQLIDYLFHKEQLDENQDLLSMWSKSWRDYNEQMFNLTDEQNQIVEDIKKDIQSNVQSNYLIQGGPGTGKTIILIHILNELLQTDIQLLTYTSSLNKYNKFVASKLFKENEEAILKKIDTFDHFIQKKAELILKKEIYIPNQNDYSNQYSKQLKEKIDILRQKDKYQSLSKTSTFIMFEALNEIWGLLPDEEKYRTLFYATGKEITNPEELQERQLIWDIIKELEAALESEKVIPLEYACYKLTLSSTNINNNYKNNYILIDEVQDLSKAKIKAISRLAKKNYIISGDLSQSVFIRKGLSWNQVSSLVKESHEIINEKALRKNFRSSASIQELANAFLNSLVIKDENIYSEGFMPGPTPDYTISETQESSFNALKNRIKLLKEKLYFSNKDFCIIASNKTELDEIHTILGDEFPSKIMEDKDFLFDENDDSIRLSTVKYIKGIDCPVVLLYLSEKYLEKKTNGNMDKNTQMNGLYACITRAMNILSIFINNSNSLLDSDNSISKLYKTLENLAIKN